ncbi:hypothetical protein DSL72_008912 [Monilinia vaccinii-corymbosi]|uniref:Uncharacterized protein n=1 Tax=Monilinia vaccinii-corymbosi TaxID=61207 RepID=A0A8A3PQI6_9HELO|nr:hypothetical protein DSL72_008912 [Monilinia vaccinii-corymbosi]
MVRAADDRKSHLHRIASSNLPVVPRKSWEYYVAILQPGIPLEKCEHADFLWMRVKGTVTIERILTVHLRRTGRNSILMDGGVGLTIDTKVEDIACLGLGVLAFWEIVRVERWWEYTVRPVDVERKLWRMRGEEREGWEIMSSSNGVPETLGSMRERTREWGVQKKRPLKWVESGMDRSEMTKRRKRQVDGESEEHAILRRKKELDDKVEVMRLQNQNPPPIHALDTLAAKTRLELQRHDEYVQKQRQYMLNNATTVGAGKSRGILQRFEISWERQRQDIINSDPQFRRVSKTQEFTEGETSKYFSYAAQQEERKTAEKQIIRSDETRLCLEAIQDQLDIAKSSYPESSFTLRPELSVVHLDCAFCPHIDISIGPRRPLDAVNRVRSHQMSIDRLLRYSEAQTKDPAEYPEGKK